MGGMEGGVIYSRCLLGNKIKRNEKKANLAIKLQAQALQTVSESEIDLTSLTYWDFVCAWNGGWLCFGAWCARARPCI